MSPIKGLSEKRRLPRLGKIHLGVKAKNSRGTEYPKMVDYFVCPPEVQAVFGEKPKELRILIPVEDEDKWASQYYRCYCRSKGLVCKGDGETCVRMVDAQTGALADGNSKEVILKEMECKGRDCADYGVKCKEVMNLQFLIPEVPGLGIWQIDTGSVNSIRNINATASLLKVLYGRVSMIPLILTVEQLDVNGPDCKKKKVSIMNVKTNETMLALGSYTAKLARQLNGGTSLENGEVITVEEAVDLPESDDEYPELIVPQEQAPPGEEPGQPVIREKTRPENLKLPLIKDAGTPVPERDAEAVTDITGLYRACNEDFRMQPKDVLKALGVDRQTAIRWTPAECYRKIAELQSHRN